MSQREVAYQLGAHNAIAQFQKLAGPLAGEATEFLPRLWGRITGSALETAPKNIASRMSELASRGAELEPQVQALGQHVAKAPDPIMQQAHQDLVKRLQGMSAESTALQDLDLAAHNQQLKSKILQSRIGAGAAGVGALGAGGAGVYAATRPDTPMERIRKSLGL